VHDHALQRHHGFVLAKAEEAAMGDDHVELLALRILQHAIDGTEFLALVVVDVAAFEVRNGDLLLLGGADCAGRLWLLADAEHRAGVTLLRLLLGRLLLSLLLLSGLLLGLLTLLHLLLTSLLLLTLTHPLDADDRATLLLLELDLRLAGALELHLRLGLLRADLRLRGLGLDLRLGLLDLNLRLLLADRNLRLRHAHDDLGLRLLHDDRGRGLADQDLRGLLLDVDLSRLLLDADLSTCGLLLRLLLSGLLLLTRLLLGLRLTHLNGLLLVDLLELSLLLLAEGLRALDLAIGGTQRHDLLTAHLDAVDRQKDLALVLHHLDDDKLLLALAIDDAGDGADRLALLADDFAIHEFADGHLGELTGLLLTWLAGLLRLHLLLRLALLRLGLLSARRHRHHRGGTEERSKEDMFHV
jgi:hypothetical protein